MPKQEETVFAFDVGKASLGICAREGTRILELKSLLIPAEFAATSEFRGRRRAFRTRQAHNKREQWLRIIWSNAGLTPLNSNDTRLKQEFPAKGDETLYNSALLRIALLQGHQLTEWQIFKALWASIQHRGYDKNCTWNASEAEANSDDTENLESVNQYIEDLYVQINSHPEYTFPCYLEASLMGLWHFEQPTVFHLRIKKNANKVRKKGQVAPRDLVEKEVSTLFKKATEQLPALRELTVQEFLYGPGRKRYASLYQEYSQHRGTEWDTQGVLSQKVPRFDNRIINKCQLLPLRNTCKAEDPLNLKFNLLQQLKNIRFTDEDGVIEGYLNANQLKIVYDLCQENLNSKTTQEVTAGNVKKFIEKAIEGKVFDINLDSREKIKLNSSGRSRFCRPALIVMNKILLSGINPPEFDLSPYIQNNDPKQPAKGLTRVELEELVSRLGKTWTGFHVGDTRYTSMEATRQNKANAILSIIGNVNSPIVRHRLTIFWNELKKLEKAFGKPDKVILEFIRGKEKEGLNGSKKALEYDNQIKANEKINDEVRKKLRESCYALTAGNIERLKLYDEQSGLCAYTGEKLSDSLLETYQVDHIVPLSNEISTDSYYNKVLCTMKANQEKGDQTPYLWLSNSDRWPEFLDRITSKNSRYGKKKRDLLTRSDAEELVSNYNGLAETAYIARLAQQIVSLYFGWGLGTRADARQIFVNDGKVTAKIRKIFQLNDLLLTKEEKEKLEARETAFIQKRDILKNRENKKHHALDAFCISFSQQLYSFQNNAGETRWNVRDLAEAKPQLIQKLNELFPEQLRRNTQELYPYDSIYGLKTKTDSITGIKSYFLTLRNKLIDLIGKDKHEARKKSINKIFDLDIQKDLLARSEVMPDMKAWQDFLINYHHPIRKSRVTNVVVIEVKSEQPPIMDATGRLCFGKYKDFGNLNTQNGTKGITKGQFKHSKQHQGQLIYFENGKPKALPVYANQSLNNVVSELNNKNVPLYQDGMLFYSGCQIKVLRKFKAGQKEFPAGIYNNKSIESSGQAKLENSSGEKIRTNIKYLVEAGFERL